MKANIKVDLLNSSKIETLILTINKYREELPDELVDALNDVLASDKFEITNEDIPSFKDVTSYPEIDRIVSVNKYLKRVKHYKSDNSVIQLDSYPEHFSLYVDGEVVVEW